MFGLTKTQTALLDIFFVVACLPFTSSKAHAPVSNFTENIEPIAIQQRETVSPKPLGEYIPTNQK